MKEQHTGQFIFIVFKNHFPLIYIELHSCAIQKYHLLNTCTPTADASYKQRSVILSLSYKNRWTPALSFSDISFVNTELTQLDLDLCFL